MVRVIAFVTGIVAGVALLLFVISGIAFTSPVMAKAPLAPSIAAQHGSDSIFTGPSDPHGSPSLNDEDDLDDGSLLDLQGDEVTPAVAKYRFDAQGNIYETHAPHTEVPHLGRPSL